MRAHERAAAICLCVFGVVLAGSGLVWGRSETPTAARTVCGGAASAPSGSATSVALPFLSNEGQFEDAVALAAPWFGGGVTVTGEGVIVTTFLGDQGRTGTVRERLVGGRAMSVVGSGAIDAKISFFRGSDPARWRGGVRAFSRVEFGEVYDRIEARLESRPGNVEKVFTVRPGGDPSTILVHVDGVESLGVAGDGSLRLRTPAGMLSLSAPRAYQQIGEATRTVDAAYRVDGDTYGFEIGPYDPAHPLVIDPLYASTYVGGAGKDGNRLTSIALDDEGSIYLAGRTRSDDFPATPGAYDETYASMFYSDVFIAKFTPDLSTLLAATFLGGGYDDGEWPGVSMEIDGEGNVVVAGVTSSFDFPTTAGAYCTSKTGGYDFFVTELAPDLSSLLASTYFGSSKDDLCFALTIDDSGDVWVAGTTYDKTSYPVTPGAYACTEGGYFEACVARFDGDLETLEASTWIGGELCDEVRDIALETDGTVWLGGWTGAVRYPTTPAAYDSVRGPGVYEGIVTSFSRDLSTLEASTMLGGDNDDWVEAILVDDAGDVYVAGRTASGNQFPTTTGAYDESYNGSGPGVGDDAFVTKLEPDLTDVLISTFLGGTGWDTIYDMDLRSGAMYVAGSSSSSDFPVPPAAYDTSYAGGLEEAGDGIVARLDSDLTTVTAATYVGGSGADCLTSMVFDGNGIVYLGGCTESDDFPMTSVSHDPSHNGTDIEWYGNDWGGDAVAVVLDPGLSSGPTGIEGVTGRADARLLGNSPDPFRRETTVAYELGALTRVRVSIYDVAGRLVRVVVDGRMPAGRHSVRWDGTDTGGARVAPGVYFCRLDSALGPAAEKMVLLR